MIDPDDPNDPDDPDLFVGAYLQRFSGHYNSKCVKTSYL